MDWLGLMALQGLDLVRILVLLNQTTLNPRHSIGDTQALASISGPIEVRLAAELPSQATFEVHIRPLSNVSATDSKSLASTIRSLFTPSLILTTNPRSLIQLVIQCLSNPRSATWKEDVTAAMINASTLAFLNAGSIPLRGVVCAIPVGRISVNSVTTLIIDPGDTELPLLTGGGCFCFMFAHGIRPHSDLECVWTNWKSSSGIFDEEELSLARELAKTAARNLYAIMKASVADKDLSHKASAIKEESMVI